MQHAANAYARTSNMALAPRDLEAAVLLKAATRLSAIREDWSARRADLDGALTYNRKLWTILATSATDDANPLPADVKAGVAKLAAFVFRHTFSVLAAPDPSQLEVLINVNREVAAGLRVQPAQAA